jgi:Ni2+-binding GTPase involved in maturation of urease and hydrogenase
MEPITLVLAGGFLGAGKTTLLARAAGRLAARGLKVGIITNDQAPQLVDTSNLRHRGLVVQEVAGGCFCCRFQDLVDSAGRVAKDFQPDVILSEPVGSCTDLSATVLQPIKELYGDRLRPAPFSVLADGTRLLELFSGRAGKLFPESVLYIYTKQLEEADLILLNKADLLSAGELAGLRSQVERMFPGIEIQAISARLGGGVDEWLDWVLEERPAGTRIVPVDYDVYADGEAALGWLNARADLHAPDGADWPALAGGLMDSLGDAFRSRGAEIAHLKVFLGTADGALVASLTSSSGKPSVLVNGTPSRASKDAELILNARVHLDPEVLRSDVAERIGNLARHGLAVQVRQLEAFRPGRPQPTHRYDRVVK